ncbi:MAG: hypothetical protein AABX25_02000 [Nanoarchaeota archaeon]
MKKLILVLSLVSVLFLLACTQNSSVACTEEAKICPDGSAVGRTGPNCEFAPCPSADTAPDQNESLKQNYCTAEQRQGDMCIELYGPVCGWFDPARIQCIKYPCANTFSNSCFACHDDKVLYWTEGECPK